MSLNALGDQKLNARHLYCITKKLIVGHLCYTLLSLVLTVGFLQMLFITLRKFPFIPVFLRVLS